MENILNVKFDAICTYDDWCVFEFKGKYYVVDYEREFIKKVKLVNKMTLEEYSIKYPDNDEIIDFGNNYCGESDDGKYALGFDVVYD